MVCAGYNGPIYCTPATAEIARIVLEDSAEIQEENAGYLNNRSRNPGEVKVQPIYTRKDVHDVLKLFRRVKYGEKTTLQVRDRRAGFSPHGISSSGDQKQNAMRAEARTPGPAFTFFDAGHILGSAYVWFETLENGATKTLLFTADVGRYDTPILRDPQALPGAADWVITESTYGNKSHGPMAEVEPQFLDAVKQCIAHRSRLLVPSFAVGRTQTVFWYMEKFIAEKKIPPIPVYVDSPMGVEISKVLCDFPQDYDEQSQAMVAATGSFCSTAVTFASSMQQSKQINNDHGPCVIIASSPTCEFGASCIIYVQHRKTERHDSFRRLHSATDTGPANSGRRKTRAAFSIAGTSALPGSHDPRPSAHADGDELLRFLKPTLTPKGARFCRARRGRSIRSIRRAPGRRGHGQRSCAGHRFGAYTSTGDLAPTPKSSPQKTDND